MDAQNEIVKRRRGPIPRPDLQRTERVSVYLTPAELAQVESRFGASGKALGRAFRNAIFENGPRPVPEINIQAWAELSRAAANLNQIARKINGGLDIENLQSELDAFRKSLMGAQ